MIRKTRTKNCINQRLPPCCLIGNEATRSDIKGSPINPNKQTISLEMLNFIFKLISQVCILKMKKIYNILIDGIYKAD